jgi:hypothetical protein
MLGPAADRIQGLSVHGSALPVPATATERTGPHARRRERQTEAKGSPPTTASSCSASWLSLPGAAV